MPLGSMPLLVQKVRSSAATTASCIVLAASRASGIDSRFCVGELARLGLAVGVVDEVVWVWKSLLGLGIVVVW